MRPLLFLLAPVVLAIGGFVALALHNRGPHVVLPTVVDDPTLPRIDLNGVAFHAEVHGPDDAPVVIVLHGGPGADHRSLQVLADLGDRYRVVLFDQRGAGLSERVPADQLTPASALADLDAFADRFSPDRPVILIGHSWGATLAAGYLRHRPDRVAAAVLAEPGYLDEAGFEDWQERYQTLMSGWGYRWLALQAGFAAQQVGGPDEHAADDFLVGQRILPAFVNHPDNPYHRPGEAYGAPMWRWGTVASEALSGETFDALGGRDDTQDGGADGPGMWAGPVLFLAGAHNTWIGEELQTRHAEAYPDASVVVIPDAGHDLFWDNPTESLAAIRRFLGARQPAE